MLFVVSGLFAAVATPAVTDTAGPVLTELTLSPLSVNTESAAATVIVTARITDDTGLSSGYSNYISYQAPGGSPSSVSFDGAQRFDGTAQNGTYHIPISLPRWSEKGTWKITSVSLRDSTASGNYS